MKTPLDTDVLVSLVDEFLAPFECDSDFDSDFFYDHEEDRVYFSVLVSERADRLFKQYVWNHFHFDPPSIFMLSLLHEVGHHYTMDFFDENEIVSFREVKAVLSEMLDACPDDDEIYSLYFDLEIEKVATNWAVTYYKHHFDRCQEFYLRFVNELRKQYSELGLTE